jgi:ATP-dependent RNA helicase DDX19/DBP5
MSSTEPPKEPTKEPVEEKAPAAEPTAKPTETPAPDSAEESSVAKAQVDGAGEEPGNGSPLADTEYRVEVKLADMQADPNNPLYSAQSFEELKL